MDELQGIEILLLLHALPFRIVYRAGAHAGDISRLSVSNLRFD